MEYPPFARPLVGDDGQGIRRHWGHLRRHPQIIPMPIVPQWLWLYRVADCIPGVHKPYSLYSIYRYTEVVVPRHRA
jgi:hypothetical protein